MPDAFDGAAAAVSNLVGNVGSPVDVGERFSEKTPVIEWRVVK